MRYAIYDEIVVIEQQPVSRNIFVNNGKYFLSFPYMYFIINLQQYENKKYYLNKLSIRVSNKPVNRLNDSVYKILIFNQHEDKICLGNISISDTSILDTAFNAVDYFWKSKFIQYNFQSNPFIQWQEDSKNKSKDIFDALLQKNTIFFQNTLYPLVYNGILSLFRPLNAKIPWKVC